MNGMFNWTPSDDLPLASPYLYVYFVVAIPVTVLVYVAWVLWFKFAEKQYKTESIDTELEDIERNLMQRMKTFTFNGEFPDSP